MKVIILCGGKGYRLKEETEFKPKPMILVGEKPIIWHIMKMYAHYGFNEFIFALGYKGDCMKDYFLNQKYFTNNFTIHTKSGYTRLHRTDRKEKDNFKITFVDTGQETLPGERILRLKNFIPKKDKNFMVTYGDGVSDIDIKELLKFHKKMNKIGTVAGVHPKSRYGLLNVNKMKLVWNFKEKPFLPDWINGGFMIFKRSFFKYLREGEFEHEAIKRIIKRKQLSIYTHEGFWYSVDTYAELDNLNRMWREDPKWKVWK